MTTIIQQPDAVLTPIEHAAIRAVCDAAFGDDYSDTDAAACSGGLRFLAYVGTTLVAHAALVGRNMVVAGEPVRVGYVEGVAVLPSMQGRGIGLALMAQVTQAAEAMYVLSMLSTGAQPFYAKLGWRVFRGESYVDDHGVVQRTADEDEGLMILTREERFLRPGIPFVCDWRPGDVW